MTTPYLTSIVEPAIKELISVGLAIEQKPIPGGMQGDGICVESSVLEGLANRVHEAGISYFDKNVVSAIIEPHMKEIIETTQKNYSQDDSAEADYIKRLLSDKRDGDILRVAGYNLRLPALPVPLVEQAHSLDLEVKTQKLSLRENQP